MQSSTAVFVYLCPCSTGAVCLAFAFGVADRTGRTSRAARVATGIKSGFRCVALPGAMSLVLAAVICATSTSVAGTGGWWITAVGGNVYATTVAPIVGSCRTQPTHRPSDPRRRVSDGDDEKARFHRLPLCIHMCICVLGVIGAPMP